MKVQAAGLGALLVFALTASADEIRLKDGTKIVGTIVGFENDSFKVQTSYGFALVRRDKIAAIIPSAAKPQAKQTAAESRTAPQDASPPTAATSAAPARPAGSAASSQRPPWPEVRPPEQAAKARSLPSQPMQAAQPVAPSPDSAPAAEASPAQISEEVKGSLYINHTYGFRMYKPPGWHLIEGAQTALPSAVAAMGTADETTVFVVGRERMRHSLDEHAGATEKQLREIYENYRRISEERTRVAGLPALARRYRGMADERDWSGVVITLARGNDIFTILGMTYADSDLIQIQENVIARTIASLEFTSR